MKRNKVVQGRISSGGVSHWKSRADGAELHPEMESPGHSPDLD